MNRIQLSPLVRSSCRFSEQKSFVHALHIRCRSVFKWIFGILIFFIFLLNWSFPASCSGKTKKLFRIGTGGTSGVYYPIGKLIAEGLTGPAETKDGVETGSIGLPGYVGVAQSSGGSVANVRALAAGEIEAGLVQADVAAWAFKEEGVFAGDGDVGVVRAVASLYPEKFQIVTRRDANIRTVMDLKGKHISIDEIGSGTLAVMRIVLDAYGLSEKDLFPVYLKPQFTDDKILRGELQGFAIMAGTPVEAVTRISDVGLFFVPIDPAVALRINAEFPYLVPGEIPADVYPGVPSTPTLEVHALLAVSSKMPDDLAYQLTAALWSRRTLAILKAGHLQGEAITPATALQGISIPLHPGAERFYREHGISLKGTQTQ